MQLRILQRLATCNYVIHDVHVLHVLHVHDITLAARSFPYLDPVHAVPSKLRSNIRSRQVA